MKAVLGIDAAWTANQPSGVALVVSSSSAQWRLVSAAPSYEIFLDRTQSAGTRPAGSLPDGGKLLAAAQNLCGFPIDLVAADLPLSRNPITGRRFSDNEISRRYGAYLCETHSPSASRPGSISDNLAASFSLAGYPLLTCKFQTPGLIEAYPHPAVVELLNLSQRSPYKCSKTRKYWPHAALDERRSLLCREWNRIVNALEEQIEGVTTLLPSLQLERRGWRLKAYEDVLDAVICAWVGICVLEYRAKAYGDDESAIWVPKRASG
jgi:predicted RNase H-like nuclease